MLDDIAGGIFKGLLRYLLLLFTEVVLEAMLKGPGYFICNLFSKTKPNPNSFTVIITGFIFWLVIGSIGYIVFTKFSASGNA
ncbi:hypothetical protein O0V09_18735 [Dasania sp. GY-19]|uniref:Uncharacterized protein n=1 Tax=Dasania phycosphaerae TaxID=2950436 RepID=A0A9J6RRC5_9GAMM|nr:hypothetical protein [Dasania phycosphaerae]MCZ0867238.1 hypothetical protein [Dasania phycosphaerae]